MRTRFERQGLPIISVDTKKRELVGTFKNNGVKWDRTPVPVSDHHFRSDAIGVAIPYGIYDLLANRGSVFVGILHDTAAFAVHSIAGWWKRDGGDRYYFTLSSAFFVVRTKSNVLLQRRYSHPVDKATGVRSDHTVILTAIDSAKAYPEALRRVSYLDVETRKRFRFLTNNFTLPALTIAQIYKCRWQVELFFKWIKQHLRIKSFFGTSENAVKTQIWIAVSVYVLVAVVRKRLSLEASLYQIQQILSVTLFEKTPILRALQMSDYENDLVDSSNQLILFDF